MTTPTIDMTAALGWLWTAVAAIGVLIVGVTATVTANIASLINAKRELRQAAQDVAKLDEDIELLYAAYNHRVKLEYGDDPRYLLTRPSKRNLPSGNTQTESQSKVGQGAAPSFPPACHSRGDGQG